ncbi:MAG: NAD(P)H-hydrate dehydratase [Lachnospiraceae bacterium]|nr:NAD(P)H-hydrate dehydratase [Lachnospiraceae bacterium]
MIRYLPTSDEMYGAEIATMDSLKIPQSVLMERAAFFAYETLEEAYPSLSKDTTILLLCGNGNNGGDALALARILLTEGYRVTCFLPPSSKRSDANIAQETSLLAYRDKAGFEHCTVLREMPEHFAYDVIIDGIFGIGLSRPIEGLWAEVLGRIKGSKAFKLSLDIPSGLIADTGIVTGPCFQADATCCFGAVKLGEMIAQGPEVCGDLYEDSIGIVLNKAFSTEPVHVSFDDRFAGIQTFLPRDPKGNKGTFGKVLLYAGDPNTAGACILAARACFGAGCGMVQILTHPVNKELILHELPEAMVNTQVVLDILEGKETGEALQKLLDWADVLAMGPGIGQTDDAHRILHTILSADVQIPLILDADALNLLSTDPLLYAILPEHVVLTPHVGEASRLFGEKVPSLDLEGIFNREDVMRSYLDDEKLDGLDITFVLKDHTTLVMSSASRSIYVNLSGDNGMAVAGSGDVLTGLLAGILAQGRNSGKSIRELVDYSVYLHGLCGEYASEMKNSYGMTASDLIPALWDLLA